MGFCFEKLQMQLESNLVVYFNKWLWTHVPDVFSAHFIHIAFGVRPSRMLRFDSDLFYLVVIASEEGRIEGGGG